MTSLEGTVDCGWIDLRWVGNPSLSSGITIWYGRTAELLAHYDACQMLLNSDEKAKAQRFHRAADRERYVLQHGYLRWLLGDHLDSDPEELSFSFGPNKKPYLIGHDEVYFNLSNSSGHFLIAIADTEIGVDIEVTNPTINYKDIAASYFGKEEIAFIEAADHPAKAFFLLWTRKEALLKACGMGIDDDLPAVPALDGKHNLPARYPVKEWHTRSFLTDENTMISLTCSAPIPSVKIVRIDSRGF